MSLAVYTEYYSVAKDGKPIYDTLSRDEAFAFISMHYKKTGRKTPDGVGEILPVTVKKVKKGY